MPGHVCLKCERALEPFVRVVQSYRGRWEGAITPKPEELFAEWHDQCFEGEYDLKPQHRPYRCQTCDAEIQFGEVVSFFVKGDETTRHYTAAERRGYALYNVNHYPGCPSPRQ